MIAQRLSPHLMWFWSKAICQFFQKRLNIKIKGKAMASVFSLNYKLIHWIQYKDMDCNMIFSNLPLHCGIIKCKVKLIAIRAKFRQVSTYLCCFFCFLFLSLFSELFLSDFFVGLLFLLWLINKCYNCALTKLYQCEKSLLCKNV